jgi:hypothetical protein
MVRAYRRPIKKNAFSYTGFRSIYASALAATEQIRFALEVESTQLAIRSVEV